MVWKITAEELLARYNTGERNFAGVEILRIVGEMGERDGVDGPITGLEGADLRGINLRGANLRDVRLSEANLTGSDLFGAYLGYSVLYKTILRDTNLFSTNLTKAVLVEADLTGACLDYICAIGASFIGAKVPGFTHADLIQANFRNSTVSEYALCRWFNVIWDTTMPDGTVKEDPHCVW